MQNKNAQMYMIDVVMTMKTCRTKNMDGKDFGRGCFSARRSIKDKNREKEMGMNEFIITQDVR